MGGSISKMAKQELVATIRDRYQQSSKKDKGRILDEFTVITRHHRKHGIRLLGGTADNKDKRVVGNRPRATVRRTGRRITHHQRSLFLFL